MEDMTVVNYEVLLHFHWVASYDSTVIPSRVSSDTCTMYLFCQQSTS